MSRLPAAGGRRYACAGLAAAVVVSVLSACSHGGSPGQTVPPAQPSAASPSASASAAAATPPAMVAVTTGGALVTLNPAAGAVQQTLVSSGVLGDEVSVSPSRQVYFAVKNGCSSTIEAIPVSGGTPVVIAVGSLPAVSPDGTKLAYANEPSLTPQCASQSSALLQNYILEIRTLSSGSTTALPMVPAGCQCGGLPAPISHLSWSPDNRHVAVSIASVQDNEGWAVNLVDTAQAHNYFYEPGFTAVPVTGPNAHQSYLREGVYMPDGNLFVSRACCGGFPIHNTSRLMWEVNTAGVLVHQVAIGYPDLDHTSLDVSADGQWLLYLAGTTVYVSEGGATPKELTTGMIAAAWAD